MAKPVLFRHVKDTKTRQMIAWAIKAARRETVGSQGSRFRNRHDLFTAKEFVVYRYARYIERAFWRY